MSSCSFPSKHPLFKHICHPGILDRHLLLLSTSLLYGKQVWYKWFLHAFGWDMWFAPCLFVWEVLLDLWLANWLIFDSLSQSGYSVKAFQGIYHTVSRWQLGGSLICWAVKLPAYAAGEAVMYRNITWEGWNVEISDFHNMTLLSKKLPLKPSVHISN